jgi:hypothetical protein
LNVLAARFAAQLLADERGADAVAVTDRLLAVQAQDLRSARLAIRARAEATTIAEIERSLTTDRTLVIGWLNRGTLHLVRRDDYWWLHALTTPPLLTGNARRLAQTGVDATSATRAVEHIGSALADAGPLTRYELRDRLRAARVPTDGQALVHLLMLACLRGVAVRGPMRNGHHAYVLAHDWIGAPPDIDRDDALAQLARRYLRGHAPADPRDLAKWAGLPLRDARAGLHEIAAELVEGPGGLVALERAVSVGRPRTCLLDQWDPLLVGWQSRDLLLAHSPHRAAPALHYHPYAYVGGYAVAPWSYRAGVVELGEPFARVARRDLDAIRRDAAAVEHFLAPLRPVS